MRKPGVACQQCRIGKRKCDRPQGVSCQPCLRRNIQCSSGRIARLQLALQPVSARSPGSAQGHQDAGRGPQEPPSPRNALDSLTPDQIQQLVGYYIEYLHDKSHSLFHVPTLRSIVADGSIDRPLLCAIVALSARFSSDQAVSSLGAVLADYATSLMQSDLETLSIDSVRAFILLGYIRGADFKSASESLFFGIATRIAYIIRLAEPRDNESAVQTETRARIWWSLYMVDRWSSAGLGTPRQMSDRQPSQRLPRREHIFHSLSPKCPTWPLEEDAPGLWAHMITLVEIFGPIQDLNRLIALGSVDASFIAPTVSNLAKRLDDWQLALPKDDRLSASTLATHQARGQGRAFVALHMGYFHYATLLYFQYLDQGAAALPWAGIYAERCREHASAFSDLLRTSNDTKDCAAMYDIVGHMTVVSSSVLIHTLLLGDEQQVEPAKARLESNFQALLRLKVWWPSVDKVTQRLFKFQRACLRSVDNRTHKIDRWTVKFLLEHGNVLDDKFEEITVDTPSPYGFSPDSPMAQRILERDRITRDAMSGLRT